VSKGAEPSRRQSADDDARRQSIQSRWQLPAGENCAARFADDNDYFFSMGAPRDNVAAVAEQDSGNK